MASFVHFALESTVKKRSGEYGALWGEASKKEVTLPIAKVA